MTGANEAVSRETARSRAFGDRLNVAETYAGLLAGAAVDRGLLGPREVSRLWERHLLNCAALAPLIPTAANVVDVGSGAGLPGVVLAIARPDLRITLLEPLQRRAAYLEEVVATLALTNCSVRRERAELSRVSGDTVTARAVAPLGRLVAWCLPLTRPGGVVLALKGRSVAAEVLAAEVELRRAGAASWEVLTIGEELGSPTSVVRIWAGQRVGRGGSG